MRLEVAGDHIDVSEILRGKVSRHVLLALSRFGARLRRVKVTLAELANPLGGVDKQCRMLASLQEGEDIRSEAIDSGFEPAAARAAGQLAQRVELALQGRAPASPDAAETGTLRPGRPRLE